QKIIECFQVFFLFSELKTYLYLAPNSAKPTQGVWGLAPRKSTPRPPCCTSFSRKRSKKRCSASQRSMGIILYWAPNSAKPTQGVWGHAPRKSTPRPVLLF